MLGVLHELWNIEDIKVKEGEREIGDWQVGNA